MHKQIITQQAPAAIGPYAQAVMAQGQNLIFVSGQIPLNPITMKIETLDIKEQTKIVLKNLAEILKAAGTGPHAVVKTTIFLKDMKDFAIVNEEYEKFFCEYRPARACVEVARLPKDALVEIEAVAVS
jgi:2-iminobutanoate/2-iminopropanoate deaminase